MNNNFFLNNKEIDQISELVNIHENLYLSRRISSYKNKDKSNIEAGQVLLCSNQLTTNGKLQDELYKLFKDNNSFNLAFFYEKQLNNRYSWRSDLLIPYTRFIKSENYYPKNDNVIYDIIKSQQINNMRTFWTMISLASLVKDNNTSINSFHLILNEKKKGNIDLLDLEKVKHIWDKRFNKIDVSKFSTKEFTELSKLFSNIETSKEKSFFNVSSGHYLSIDIDVDLISQENKLSKAKNIDALRTFFNSFQRFSEKSKELSDVLSVNEFSQRSNTNLTFHYSDLSKKDIIQSFVCDLVDYATSKFETNKLKGTYINEQDTDKFFSSYVMNYLLENTLSKNQKNNTQKLKI